MKYQCLYMNDKQKIKYQKIAGRNYKSEESLEKTVVKNGIILPGKPDLYNENPKLWSIGGVVDSEGHFIESSSTRYFYGGNYEVDLDRASKVNEKVIFFGPFVAHWGHFLCDQISRLWYVLDHPNEYKIAYCSWGLELYGNFMELFELVGIPPEQIIDVSSPTCFQEVIIPDVSFIPGEFYTDEFERLIDHIVKNCTISKKNIPEKIYFTRSNLIGNNDKEHGEDNIATTLIHNGYEVLSPETLSLREQIFYINHAKQIAMLSGSIAHNLMFCRKETEVIIFNKIDLINDYQSVIDHMTRAKITYVDAYMKILPVLFGNGPFLFKVSKYFKQFLKDQGMQIVSTRGIQIRDYFWYFKQYYKIYKIPQYREFLKAQKQVQKLNDMR
ncbi:MAG: glycosyltransferase family 61 protein [Bacilli bacterium]|nr:glycosyltransferase family 61 protein [Bacilli bacterium]